MKFRYAVAVLAALWLPYSPVSAQGALPSVAQRETAWSAVTPEQGMVPLSAADAILDVPNEFVFFDAADSTRILQEIWGNPPEKNVLGLIMPANVEPWRPEAYGVAVLYEPIGYVRDDDASTLDYTQMLDAMQRSTAQGNAGRVKAGYPGLTLVGWARPPFYDDAENKLHWAKRLRFDKADADTLNYEVRVLGRRGVLVLSFIAQAKQLPEIRDAAPDVMKMAAFNPGARYDDFDPATDKVAAVGIGGLISGEADPGAAAKGGLALKTILLWAGLGAVAVLALGYKLGARRRSTEGA